MSYRVLLHDRLLKVGFERPGSARAARMVRQRRGEIRGLSHGSKARLIRFLATIRSAKPACFVTLTYLEFCDDFRVWKRHLNRWLDALRKAFPEVAGIWRLEFQRRGAPHYHLLLWAEDLDPCFLRFWATDRWLAAIGQDTPALRENAVHVQPVFDLFNSQFYLSLHHSKKNQDRTDIKTGREWGTINVQMLETAPVESQFLGEYEIILARRVLRQIFRSRHRGTYRASRYYRSLLRDDRGFSSLMALGEQLRLFRWIKTEFDRRLAFP